MELQDWFFPVVGLDNELETDVDNVLQELSCLCRTLFVDWKDICFWCLSTKEQQITIINFFKM